MMKFGMPTFMEFSSVEEHLVFCKDNGFGSYELAFYYPWTQSNRLDLNELEKLKSKYNIDFSIHLPTIDPFAFSLEIKKAAYDTVYYMFDVADSCGAKILNMHLNDGEISSICGTKFYVYEHYKREYLDNAKRFRDTISPLLEKSGCILCTENTHGFKPFQKEALEILLQNRNFGLTYDIGHNFKAGRIDEEFILSHADSVRHFHIHDASESSCHISLGQGLLNITHYLNLASDLNASTLIEVKSPECLMQSAQYLKDKGYM